MAMNLATKCFLLPVCLFVGCNQLKGLPDRHVYREVEEEEIVGVWEITDDSCMKMRAEGYRLNVDLKDHRIIFRNDGTCRVRTFTISHSHPSKEEQVRGYIMDQEGTWKLVTTSAIVGHERRNVRAVKVEIEKVGHASTSWRGLSLYLAEEESGLVLWKYLGDPDYVKYVDFIKSTFQLESVLE